MLSRITVPVGNEPFCAVPVAVVVTCRPTFDGFGAVFSTVVVEINSADDTSFTSPTW